MKRFSNLKKIFCACLVPLSVWASPAEDEEEDPPGEYKKLPFSPRQVPEPVFYASMNVSVFGKKLAGFFTAVASKNEPEKTQDESKKVKTPSKKLIESTVHRVSEDFTVLRTHQAQCALFAITYTTGVNAKTKSIMAPDRFMILSRVTFPKDINRIQVSSTFSFYATNNTKQESDEPPLWSKKSIEVANESSDPITSWSIGFETDELCKSKGFSPTGPDA